MQKWRLFVFLRYLKGLCDDMKMTQTGKLTITGMLFAIGLVLPFLTGQIPQIGSMLLPMHIPVFLCGLICGGGYGAMMGILLPVVRSLLFGMPPLYPTAAAMAFELAAYGAVAGGLYFRAGYFCVKSLYRSMVPAMIIGRIVWAVAMIVLMGLNGGMFTVEMFMAGALLNAVPGIALQLILVPAIMVALGKTKLIHFGMEAQA